MKWPRTPSGPRPTISPLQSANDFTNHFDQLGRIERLDQPAGSTGGAAGLLHLVARLGGEDQDRSALELGVLAQLLGQADAIHARHVLVGQHEVEVAAVGLLVGVLAVHGLNDVEAGVPEGEGHHLAHGGGIVNGKDRVHVFSS